MSFTDGSFNCTISGSNALITGFSGNRSIVTSLVIPGIVTNTSTGTSYNVINVSGLSDFIIATSLNIPASVINVGQACFARWAKLTNVTFEEPSQLNDGLLAVFRDCTSLTNITIPGKTTALKRTFYGCSSLTNVTLPSTITSFSDNTFANTGKLVLNWESLTKLTSIGSTVGENFNAFAGSDIENVIIPASVTMIGSTAFSDCDFLKTFTFLGEKIPTTIASDAFSGCATIPNNCICFIQRGTSRADITRLETIFGIGYVLYEISICFKENTKILTDKGYIPIEKLRKGDLVKTLLHGYVPINCIGKKVIYHNNSDERTKDKLYKCSSTEFPEIFEPLILTGCHSILVENSIEVVNEEQIKKVIEINGNIYLTDGKLRLPACVDERTSIFETSGNYTIYHIALEHEDEYMNYGIYANGLLVESCSEWSMKEFSNLSIVE